MNKYPGIYKALDGTIYYYLNKSNFFSPERGRWEEDCDNDDHKTDVNITADYLRNTKVKIESEEHEVFVREIASSGNLKCAVLNGYAFIFDNFIEDVNKLITIPLPPKESLMPDFNVEAPMSKVKPPKKVSMNDIQVNVQNNTDSVVQVTKSDDESNIFIQVNDLPKSEEWPQVGDEVVSVNPEGLIGVIMTPEYKGEFCVKYNTGLEVQDRTEFAKPPTPEEELSANIANAADSDDIHSTHVMIAKAIISGEIEGLEYKPQ